MSRPEARIATRGMSTEAKAPVRTVREQPVAVKAGARERPPTSPLEEFEQVYLRNVDVLMGYFARRCRDPQTVADLTSETFVRAVEGFARFDPHRDRPLPHRPYGCFCLNAHVPSCASRLRL